MSHLSDAGPVVRPGLVPPDSHVNHGLYSEAVTRLHHADSLVLGIVRNVGGAVKQPADSKKSNISSACSDSLSFTCECRAHSKI